MACLRCSEFGCDIRTACRSCGGGGDLAAVERDLRTVSVVFAELYYEDWLDDRRFHVSFDGPSLARWKEVRDGIYAPIEEMSRTWGAVVCTLRADGVIGVFQGTAIGESAVRAVTFALMSQRIARQGLDRYRGGGAPLGMRAGVVTGKAAMGIVENVPVVLGPPVNMSFRMAEAAAIGAVYACAATADATGDSVEWRSLRPLRLSGYPTPVETFELLGFKTS